MKSTIIRCLSCLCLTLAAVWAVSQTDETPTPPPATCTPPGIYCSSSGTTTQAPNRQNNVFVSSIISGTDLTILTNMLSPTNTNNSHITGVVVLAPSGCLGSGCMDGGPQIDWGGQTNGGVYCPFPNFSSLNTFISAVWQANTTNRKLTNIVVSPAGYNINSQTPANVFSQGWANTLKDCGGASLYNLTWTAGALYMPGDYIKDSGGNFWQIQTGTANTTYTASHVSYNSSTQLATITVSTAPPSSLIGQSITVTLASPSGASQYNVVDVPVSNVNVSGTNIVYPIPLPGPSYSGAVTAGDITGDARCVAGSKGAPTPAKTPPYIDGTTSTACTWYGKTANAPLQDAWVSDKYMGSSAYQLILSNTAGQSCTGGIGSTCTVTLTTPYVGSNGDKIVLTGVPAPAGTSLNCPSGCTVSSVGNGTTKVTYNAANTTGLVSTVVTCGSACPLTAQRVFNAGSVNGAANLNVLASGFPTAYEAPMKTWIKYICQKVYNQYAHDTRVGYIRCGVTEGGEANTVGLSENPGWPFGSQSVFVSYYMDFMKFESGLTTGTSLVCMGNLNSFDLPEGQISVADGCGIGTNGYKVDDVVALSFNPPSDCLTINAIQSDWCWNFNQYGSVVVNGRQPILELQTSKTSTPGNNTLTNTGGLAVDNGCMGTYCPWPGLLPVAKLNLANDGEWYMCDFEIAYDSNYVHDGCNAAYAGYQMAYQGAFAGFAP